MYWVIHHHCSLSQVIIVLCTFFSKFDLLVHTNENEQFAETEVYPIDT